MEVIKEIRDFYTLKNECWSGALDTLKCIENNEKISELMELLENTFYDDYILTMTQLNDFLWFDREQIYEELEISTEED